MFAVQQLRHAGQRIISTRGPMMFSTTAAGRPHEGHRTPVSGCSCGEARGSISLGCESLTPTSNECYSGDPLWCPADGPGKEGAKNSTRAAAISDGETFRPPQRDTQLAIQHAIVDAISRRAYSQVTHRYPAVTAIDSGIGERRIDDAAAISIAYGPLAQW